ncbi:HPr family phosphocarrier protein [Halalkalibacter kiskunsagensis]|uniref:Phosphocarrier protein HPr n=1 Tax=Halalkalibacter kiskunsagensis TaxID=1548599 RepID=A0ABV6KCC0_9BACI
MVEKIYLITSESGIHARPASLLVNKIKLFSSVVILEYKGIWVSLKSIEGVLALAIPYGETIKIIAQGDDEEHVLSTIEKMMKTEGLGV